MELGNPTVRTLRAAITEEDAVQTDIGPIAEAAIEAPAGGAR